MTATVHRHLSTARIATRSASYDEASGTVEAVYSTGARVERIDDRGAPYLEELVISADAIVADRLDAGVVHLIHDHIPLGLPAGRVVSHRIDGDAAIAVIQLSDSPEAAGVVTDIRSGVIRSVSVGYLIHESEAYEEDGAQIVRVTRWEPIEISLTVMPADPAAQIRSAPAKPALRRRLVKQAIQPKGKDMAQMKTRAKPGTRAAGADVAADVLDETAIADAAAAVAAEADADVTAEDVEGAVEEAISTAVETAIDEVVAEIEAENGDEDEAAAADAVAAERTRAAGIAGLASRHGLSQDFVRRHVTAGTPISALRSAVIETRASRSAAPISTARAHVRTDAHQTMLTRMADGLASRITRSSPSPHARQFAHYRLRDIGREIVGPASRGMDDRSLFTALMQKRSGSHSTSDFAAVLSSSASKAILARYEAAPKTYEPLVRRVQHVDYKEVEKFRVGDAPKFKRRAEGAEIEFGTMSENAEKFRIYNDTAGISFTFETFVNDDLDIFGDIARSFGTNAALREAELVYDILVGGYRMADGRQLFHASHGNLISAALSVEGLDAGITAMEGQKSLDGNLIGITPSYLVVGSKNRLTAQRLLANITPANVEDVNPFGNSNIQLIVEPRISDFSWFLVADPHAYDGIQLASLAGSNGVHLETIENFYKRSIDYIASIDLGAAPVDYRPMLKSTGTGA